THPGDVVKEEQALKLKVISLDSERHRLGLSLKQAQEEPVRETPAAEPKRETRRARPERSFSLDDAVQEPEGGIDTSLAAAFAGIREKMSGAPDAAPAAVDAAVVDASADAPADALAEAPAGAADDATGEAAPGEATPDASA
ncbi:MAG: hypothetical protein RIR19_484, partial [Chloroflexota bacterium]